jgi:hypothetical protein
MRRLEAGPSGGGGADNSAKPLELLVKTGNGCGGRERAQRAPNLAEVQAAVFPDVRQASTGGGCWGSGPLERWVKNCDPTGVTAEQTT